MPSFPAQLENFLSVVAGNCTQEKTGMFLAKRTLQKYP
jgi:hypothetical protein